MSAGNRIIDLSRAAAEELGMLGLGFKEVVLMVPESTPEVAVAPPLAARKRSPVRQAAALHAKTPLAAGTPAQLLNSRRSRRPWAAAGS